MKRFWNHATIHKPYLFVETIIKVTAPIANKIPITMLVVSTSPKQTVPTRIAVIGSNTPRTEALVAPMLRVAIAKEAVETTVGNKASPTRFIQAPQPSMPVVIGASERRFVPKKIHAPTIRE